MKRKISHLNFIEFINTFSIWVLLGAIVCFAFFSKLHLNYINYRVAIILGLGCWWVYTLDHLWDGINTKNNTTSLRHFIHRVYAKQLIFILILLLLFLLVPVLLFVPFTIIRVGIIVAGLTALHFFINHLFAQVFKKGLFFKELMIAIVVTIGFCLLPGFEQSNVYFCQSWKLDASSFFTLSLANLLLFTIYDYDLDKQNGFASSSQVYGVSTTRNIAIVLLSTSIIMNGINLEIYNQSLVSFGVISAMQLALIAIFLFPNYFKLKERFRFWGDFIYLIPGLALPFL